MQKKKKKKNKNKQTNKPDKTAAPQNVNMNIQ